MLRSALCKNKNKTCSDFVAQLKLFHSFFSFYYILKIKIYSPTHLDTILSATLRLFLIISIIITIIIIIFFCGSWDSCDIPA